MEHQTRFNLSAALQSWREELAAQPNLAPETRRELETHVRDTVAEMQQRGLNDEESFWLARRRVGPPNELGAEFAKADPAKSSRQAVLWVAFAFFAVILWRNFTDGLLGFLLPRKIAPGQIWIFEIGYTLAYLSVVWLAVSLARGSSFPKLALVWRFLTLSRSRFFVAACVSFVSLRLFAIGMPLIGIPGHFEPQEWNRALWSALLNPVSLVWPVVLIALIAWLLPVENRETTKSA